jgi:hypothetical protein
MRRDFGEAEAIERRTVRNARTEPILTTDHADRS